MSTSYVSNSEEKNICFSTIEESDGTYSKNNVLLLNAEGSNNICLPIIGTTLAIQQLQGQRRRDWKYYS